MKGFQPKTPVMPTTQGVAPGYGILGFQPIFYPKQRGYAMDKRGRKENCQLSIINCQLFRPRSGER
ncbi:hypothetical protein NEE14_012480 [Parabacteroides sp. AD58]|uniref:Uncharacterized protein n=1 Tax=Parabacteroides absconsus TaxID=2951805 RepID=A0ABZ2IPS5_9BACT|nr:hypothetical protein [Parabacteroides sp. AD58]MCM6903287.1 hypothetical protein [Parabacteroides sp. AD58]